MGDLGAMWQVIRILLFLFNLFFFVFGIIIIGLGGYTLDKYGAIFALDDGKSWSSAPAMFIVVGVFIAILSFLGFVGACAKNRWLLYIFGIGMAVTFILTLTAIILGFKYKDKVEEELGKTLWNSLPKYNSSSGVKTAWDHLQKDWPKCCGVYNYTDWLQFNLDIPSSCCITTDPQNPAFCSANPPENIRQIVIRQQFPVTIRLNNFN
jgi:tetraspanin-3